MLKYLCVCDRCGKENTIDANLADLRKFFPSVAMDNRFCVACEKSRAELDRRVAHMNDAAFKAWLQKSNCLTKSKY